jgi:hypothetical protein
MKSGGTGDSGDTVTLARLGEVGALRGPGSSIRFGVELDGIGCHPNGQAAARIAAVEALERHSAAVGGPRHCLVSSAAALDESALDLVSRRLYEAPRRLSFAVLPEEAVSPCPSPLR